MKNTPLILTLVAVLVINTALAQTLDQRVTIRYSNAKLGNVLSEISEQYAVSFTYSSHFIPMNQSVSVRVRNQPLSEALDAIFEPTGVVYANIGGQVVLKMGNSPKKQSEDGRITQLSLPKEIKQESPVHPMSERERWLLEQMKKQREQYMTVLEKSSINEIKDTGGGDQVLDFDVKNYRLEHPPQSTIEPDDQRLAQVSILPFVGTNALNSGELTNNVSLNVFWGVNGGVEGLEVGGFFNHIRNDVMGVQVAGLGNTVGGNTIGTQASGLFNVNRGKMQGVQAAGLFNVAGKTDAVQVAGLFNITTQDFAGLQAAGFFNISAGKADGIQLSSLFNIANGKTKAQFSSLFNVAKDVQFGQASAFLNVGKKVRGFQIGLINVADTVSGIPIGLLNIVKHGYNHVEFSANEALYANFGLKLGARSFYNVFHVGARWDDIENTQPKIVGGTEPDAPQTSTIMSWGLGYGIGTTIAFSPRTLLNIEAVAIHVNELERWTEELNLLNQLRMTIDLRTSRHTSFFAGPVGNVMISKLQRADYNAPGSMIAPYTLYEETSADGTTIQAWVGFNAGIRF